MDDLPSRIAAAKSASVTGQWQRHVATAHAHQALDGRTGYARWGTADGFPVLYLGQPLDSVVVEAYRHLIDPIEDPQDRADLLRNQQARTLVTCTVAVTEILDLRLAVTRGMVGLPLSDLISGTEDRQAYDRCQTVAQVAHQLGRHGIIAPAATQMGETLALFTDLLPASERPARTEDDQVCRRLPPDPRANPGRQLTLVRN